MVLAVGCVVHHRLTAQGSFTFKVIVLILVLGVMFASCFLNYWEIHLYFSLFEENKMVSGGVGQWQCEGAVRS